MARISQFTPIVADQHKVHDPVECGYKAFTAKDGGRILQLDTYGSPERVQPGTISQSIQLDAGSATRLVEIIREAFPGVG